MLEGFNLVVVAGYGRLETIGKATDLTLKFLDSGCVLLNLLLPSLELFL